MFTDSSNLKLYTFDGIAGGKTGSLDVTMEETGFFVKQRRVTIEFNPVTQGLASVSPFKDELDVTWHGAVVTFDSGSPQDTIYRKIDDEVCGLWVIVEHPPIVAVS